MARSLYSFALYQCLSIADWKFPVHMSLSRQLCIFLSDRLLCEQVVHATFDLLMASAQESLNFWAHAQQKSVMTCALFRLSPWPHVTVLRGLNCLSNSKRDACGNGVTQVCSHLLHQLLDELQLLIAEHVCRCLETAILVSGVHCEERR